MNGKRLLIIGVFMSLFAFSTGAMFDLFAAEEIPNVTSVTPGEAKEIISTESDFVILDVRTPGEFTGPLGHLKGATLIPVQELGKRLGEIEQYRNKKLLVVCRSGVRSTAASRMLSSAGFKDIVNIGGGMVGMNKVKAEIIH